MARVRVLSAGEIADADGHCPEAFKAFLAFYRPR